MVLPVLSYSLSCRQLGVVLFEQLGEEYPDTLGRCDFSNFALIVPL